MKYGVLVLLVLHLSGCMLSPPRQEEQFELSEMLQQGIREYHAKGSPAELNRLIATYPKSGQAMAAKQVLELPHPIEAEKLRESNRRLSEALDALQKENALLKEDLEDLRQLLIESEKRAP